MNEKLESQTQMESVEVIVDTDEEDTLRTISTFVLVIGICISIFSFVTLSFITVEYPNSEFSSLTEKKYVFNPSGFIVSICILIGSILLSSFLKVISNISISLKELNSNK